MSDTLGRMKANLEACRRTRIEVAETRVLEEELAGIFEAGQAMYLAYAGSLQVQAEAAHTAALADAAKLARGAIGVDRDGYRKEFIGLLDGDGPQLQAWVPPIPPRGWPGDDAYISKAYGDYVVLLPVERAPKTPYVVNTQRTADLHHKSGRLSFAAMCFNGVG